MISVWNLGFDSSTKNVFKKGMLVHSQNVILDVKIEIQELGKYIQVESESIQHQQMK
jgi:hypothetical protein